MPSIVARRPFIFLLISEVLLLVVGSLVSFGTYEVAPEFINNTISSFFHSFYTLLPLSILGALLPLLLIISSIKLRNQDIFSPKRWLLVAVASWVAAAIISYYLLSLLAYYSLLSQLMNESLNFVNTMVAYESVFYALWIVAVLSGLLGIAISFSKTGILQTIRDDKRRLALVSALVVLLAVVVLYYFLFSANIGNANALRSLNGKIYEYGGNMRYLLANASLYNAALGKSTSSVSYGLISSEVQNQSSVLGAFQGPIKESKYLDGSILGTNWGVYRPFLRATILVGISYLGLDPISKIAPNNKPVLIVPKNVNDLESIYELSSSYISVMLSAQQLGDAFRYGLFNSSEDGKVYPSIGIATGIPALPSSIGMTNVFAPSFPYSTQITSSWLSIMLSKGINPANITGLNITTRELFYSFALNQYYNYFFSQMLYNQSIEPTITFVGYENDALVVNLGNLNLTKSYAISLYIDGNQTNYTKYYNTLIAKTNLGVGFHNITVSLNGNALSQRLYVSPLSISSTIYSGNYLYLYLSNAYYKNISISNISLSYDVPSGYFNSSYDWICENQAQPSPVNITFTTYTSSGLVQPAPYGHKVMALTGNGNYAISRNQTAELLYHTSLSCLNKYSVFHLSANTTQGRENYTFVVLNSP
jgi:hypothetical protein